MEERHDRQSRRIWLYGCGTLLLLGFVGLVVLATWARRNGSRTRARVLALAEQSIGPLDDRFLADFPPRGTNEDALHFEILAGAIGVDITPRVEKRSHTSREAVEALKATDLSPFLLRLSELPDDELPGIPENIVEFCATYANELDELAREARDTSPLWLMDARQGFAAPIGNLLGVLKLQRVMLGCAVVRESQGDLDGARRLLDASWSFSEERGERPELISALIRIAVAKYQLGVVRRLECAEEDWLRRVEQLDPRGVVTEGMRGEAYMSLMAAEDPVPALVRDARPPGAERLLVENPVVMPWVQGAFYDVLEATVRSHQRALETGVCEFDMSAVAGEQQKAIESANPVTQTLASFLVPNLQEAWARANRIAFDVEATRRILAFKQALRDAARPPRTAEEFARFLDSAGLETGTACSKGGWVYELHEESGDYVVRWEGPEIRSDFGGVNLSTEHRIPVPGR